MKLMLEQINNRKGAEIKKDLTEVCCGEKSKLASHFKESGGEPIRVYLPKPDVSKDHSVKALKKTIEGLQEEVKIWISIPCHPLFPW